jgi:hypothetical protein
MRGAGHDFIAEAPEAATEEERASKVREKMEGLFKDEPVLLKDFDDFWATRDASKKEMLSFKPADPELENVGELIGRREADKAQMDAYFKEYFADQFRCDCNIGSGVAAPVDQAG